jgi:hypothetical protein
VRLGYSEMDARDQLDLVRRGRDAGAAGDVEGLVKAVLQM